MVHSTDMSTSCMSHGVKSTRKGKAASIPNRHERIACAWLILKFSIVFIYLFFKK